MKIKPSVYGIYHKANDPLPAFSRLESNARINAAARIHADCEDRRMMKDIQSPLALNELLNCALNIDVLISALL